MDDRVSKEAVHCRVFGIVQGVGFRYSAQARARQLGLTGWVRNCNDGTVEVYAEGGSDQVHQFIQWLHKGPPAAVVEQVQVRQVQPSGTFQRFSIE